MSLLEQRALLVPIMKYSYFRGSGLPSSPHCVCSCPWALFTSPQQLCFLIMWLQFPSWQSRLGPVWPPDPGRASYWLECTYPVAPLEKTSRVNQNSLPDNGVFSNRSRRVNDPWEEGRWVRIGAMNNKIKSSFEGTDAQREAMMQWETECIPRKREKVALVPDGSLVSLHKYLYNKRPFSRDFSASCFNQPKGPDQDRQQCL